MNSVIYTVLQSECLHKDKQTKNTCTHLGRYKGSKFEAQRGKGIEHSKGFYEKVNSSALT